MRQHILRLVCDDCGRIETFEILNSEPLTATLNIGDVTEKAGWYVGRKEGASRFVTRDLCPACKPRSD